MNYTRAQKRAWYAARRAAGLCVECPLPSVKFSRCACCRQLRVPKRRTWEARYRQTHRAAIRARARATYQEQKAA